MAYCLLSRMFLTLSTSPKAPFPMKFIISNSVCSLDFSQIVSVRFGKVMLNWGRSGTRTGSSWV